MSGEWCVVNNKQSLFSTVAITDSDSNGTGDCNFQLVASYSRLRIHVSRIHFSPFQPVTLRFSLIKIISSDNESIRAAIQ